MKLEEGWDPPAALPPLTEEFKQRIRYRVLVTAIEVDGKGGSDSSNTELDSHANMIVLGRYCYIIADGGKVIDVSTFAEAAGSLSRVPIVDAVIAYDCPRTHKTYLLICRNALYVESMEENLIPPFILREAGLIVNECPKQHRPNGEATDDDHTIMDPKSDMKIPMKIRSTFSYFETRMPTEDDIDNGEPVLLTPEADTWDPYDESYAELERSMMDCDGGLSPTLYRHLEMIEEEDYPSLASTMALGEDLDRKNLDAIAAAFEAEDYGFDSKEEATIALKTAEIADAAIKPCSITEEPAYDQMPFGQDQVRAVLTSVSNTLDPIHFADALVNDAAASMMKMSIGSTTALPPEEPDDLWGDEPWHVMVDLNDLEEGIDRLESEVSASVGGRAKGVSPEHLSKIWSIDLETAKKTIDITTQYLKHEGSDHLSRRYPTNDRMLRYKRIRTHFFMDTFHVTSKAQSSRGNKHMQLFVSDTGFMYTYPMKSKSEIPNAVKAFAKEIGVPLSLILDPEGTQRSHKLDKITKDMGCRLKFLERKTQWANLAELYIGLLKEAVRKDMKDTDSPLKFWDYCAERRVKINNLTAKNLFQLHGSNANQKITGDPGDI